MKTKHTNTELFTYLKAKRYAIEDICYKYRVRSDTKSIEFFYVMNKDKSLQFFKLITRNRDNTRSVVVENVSASGQKAACLHILEEDEARRILSDFVSDKSYRII